MYAPIRDGNRGGRGLFSWEDVRIMSYKDRECYLGSTVNLGFLDKGGRWRKRDWWTKHPEQGNGTDLQEEMRRIKEEDQQHLDEALGLKAPAKPLPMGLSESEVRELTQKGKKDGTEPGDEGVQLAGVGYVKQPEEQKEKHKFKRPEEKRKHRSHKKHHEKHFRD